MRKNKRLSVLWPYGVTYRREISWILICALVSSACVITTPLLIGNSVDLIAGMKAVNFAKLVKNLGFLLLVYSVQSLASWFLSSRAISVSNKIVKDMRQAGFNKINSLPLHFLDGNLNGDIMSKFSNDMDAINEGVIQFLTQLFSGVLTMIGSMVFMLWIDLRIGIAVIIATPLAFVVAKFIAKASTQFFRKQQKILAEYNAMVEEAASNFALIKSFGYETEIQKKSNKLNQRLYKWGQKAQFYASLVNPSTRLINNISYVLVGLIGGLMGATGGITIGAISSLLGYSAQFAKPLNEMTGIATQLQMAWAGGERFLMLMEEKSEIQDQARPDITNIKGEVNFSQVAFSYRPEIDLIKDFTMHIPPGSMVAIVGSTGAGKTTIVNLLMRFYDINEGSIQIDKQDIQGFNRDSVRLGFGMVLQDTWLFSGTVKQNIAYGNQAASEAEVIEAAQKARAHGFIQRLPQGYDTILSAEVENLSQGEKQLITIARAMLTRPSMLILDEATSSVDPRTELKIQEAMQTFMKGKTSFVIAHRLSTIEMADIILVMDKGKIVESGTHKELVNAGSYYANLYQSQFSPL